MIKFLQILGITLLGLIFIALAYLLSTYWENYKIVPASIIAYASFISLILLKDKTLLFNNVFEWIWIRLFMVLNRLVIVNLFLLMILILICWTGYKQFCKHNYNAYLTVYEKNSANYKEQEKVELFNLITKEKLVVNTDESGRAVFHIDIPSVWQKTYKNYRYPEEKIQSSPYGFKIDLATIKDEAVETKISSDSSIQNIGIWQMPTVSLNRGATVVIGNNSIKSDNYLVGGISNLKSFVERNGFIINYNTLLKVPNCIAYRIFNTTNSFPRTANKFYRDVELESPSSETYRNSGYDRGNMVRRSDMFCHGEKAVQNTYLTSAIVPQAPKMNRETWLKLENYTSQFASDTIYIIAGVLFLNNDTKGNTLCPVIGDEKVAVPSHLYRIISRKVNGNIESLAFIIPNSNNINNNFQSYLVSIKEIEEKTGIIFFSDLPESQQKFKKIKPNSIWE